MQRHVLVVVLLLVAAGAGALAIKARTLPLPSSAPLASPTLPATGSTDLYVSPSGDDAADGSRAAPLATVQAAIERADPGATLWLADGTYGGFDVDRSGTKESPLTIAAAPGASATIVPGSRDATIALRNVHDVRLVGLAVTGPTGSTLDGIRIERSARIAVEGGAVTGTQGGFGIEVRFSSEITIRDNEIAHNAVGIRLYGEGDPASVHDVLIEGNAIHDSDSMVVNDAAPDNDFGANAIIWHKVTGTTVARDNQIWGSRAASHDYGIDGGAFEIWASSNMEITDNTVWDNVNVMETGTDGAACANITFLRNTGIATTRGVGLILRCASDSLIAHNVLDGVRDYAFELSDRSGGNPFAGSIDGLQIVDNIVVGTRLYAIRNTLPDSVTLDYNLVWHPGGSIAQVAGEGDTSALEQLTAWTGHEVHSVAADPRFADAAAFDYHLLAGSPAIDAGTPVAGETYEGAAPDIGRFEGAVSPPSSP